MAIADRDPIGSYSPAPPVADRVPFIWAFELYPGLKAFHCRARNRIRLDSEIPAAFEILVLDGNLAVRVAVTEEIWRCRHLLRGRRFTPISGLPFSTGAESNEDQKCRQISVDCHRLPGVIDLGFRGRPRLPNALPFSGGVAAEPVR